MTTKYAAYRKSFQSNPNAFLEGVVSFCKKASNGDDDESLLGKIFPWVLGIGGAYGAMLLGDTWGRHAARTGNDMGPVRGPLFAAVNKLMHKPNRITVRQDGATEERPMGSHR